MSLIFDNETNEFMELDVYKEQQILKRMHSASIAIENATSDWSRIFWTQTLAALRLKLRNMEVGA